jgi:DNA-binding MarR family transcriptional regulator
MPQLTKSQMTVLEVLKAKGEDGITPKEILSEVDFAPRTVRYALRKLLQMNLVRRIPCLQDMRQHIYIPS